MNNKDSEARKKYAMRILMKAVQRLIEKRRKTAILNKLPKQ
jgi:hypothetical protein